MQGKSWIYGKHTVVSVLRNQSREVYKVLVSQQAHQFLKENTLISKGLHVQIVQNQDILREVGSKDAVHQGFAALVGAVNTFTLDELIQDALVSQQALFIALDQITDPHNIGAIIRSCAGFGVDGIIITKHHSNINSPTVAKSSSGMIDLVKIYEVTNLSNAINLLKENGVWVIGLDSNTDLPLNKVNKFDKCLLILGSEGDGLRRMTKEHCDLLVKIPLNPQVESLNVSNAAAIAIYTLKVQE
jgi:23S rRNA (guanosine2251-2'-O)-methyltransferase